MSQEDRRTVAEVLAQREMAMLGGCCDRFAEQSPCSCLEEAILREAELRRVLSGLKLGQEAEAGTAEGSERVSTGGKG